MKKLSFLWRTALLSAALAVADSAQAGFQYNGEDLVLGFRRSGGTSELVVDLGQVSKYLGLAAGTTVQITGYDTNALFAAFPSLDGLSWSVSGDVRTTIDTNFPLQTLWVTSPRADLNTQTTPWVRQSQYAQGAVGAKISGLGNAAGTYGGTVPSGTNNTATLVSIPAGSPYAYSPFIGVAGNFAGTFQGNAEQTTPVGFAGGAVPVRADLYGLKPGTGAGTYLGYFELGTNGMMTYTAGPATAVVAPPTLSIVRTGTTNTISFTSATGVHYGSFATNGAGLTSPVAGWPAVGSAMAGTGSILSLIDITTDTNRFYVIKATP